MDRTPLEATRVHEPSNVPQKGREPIPRVRENRVPLAHFQPQGRRLSVGTGEMHEMRRDAGKHRVDPGRDLRVPLSVQVSPYGVLGYEHHEQVPVRIDPRATADSRSEECDGEETRAVVGLDRGRHPVQSRLDHGGNRSIDGEPSPLPNARALAEARGKLALGVGLARRGGVPRRELQG